MPPRPALAAFSGRGRTSRCHTVSPAQTAAVVQLLGRFMDEARARGVTDSELAEWLFGLCGRWLAAHGYSKANLHQWLTLELERRRPLPLTAAARAPKDFGGASR